MEKDDTINIGGVDVSKCEYLNIKNLTLNWGIGKEYTKEYKCKKHNNLSCEFFDECEYKRCKRLNDYIGEIDK